MITKITRRAIFLFNVVAWLFISSFAACHAIQWLQKPTFIKPTDNDIIKMGKACAGNAPDQCHNAWIVQGKITPSITKAVQLQLEQDGNVLPFCFASMGGEITPTRDILTLLYEYDATVCVAESYFIGRDPVSLSFTTPAGKSVKGGLCLSACSFIFGAAPHRLMIGDGMIGVHNGERILDFCFCQISLGQPDISNILDDLQGALDIVRNPTQHEGLIRLVSFISTIPNSEMHFLTPDELNHFGLIDEKR